MHPEVQNEAESERETISELSLPDALSLLEDLSFMLNGWSNNKLGALELFNVLCANCAHAGSQGSDQILRAVVCASWAVENLFDGTGCTDMDTDRPSDRRCSDRCSRLL